MFFICYKIARLDSESGEAWEGFTSIRLHAILITLTDLRLESPDGHDDAADDPDGYDDDGA